MERGWKVFRLVFMLAVLMIASCSLVADTEEEPGEPAPPASSTTGTIIVDVATEPAGQAGSFTFTGVPTGTVTAESTLVVTDLEPGTYTTTEVDPAPDFDVTAVTCDDSESGSASSGNAQTRTAVINLDAGETVNCTFTNAQRGSLVVASQTEPEGLSGSVQFTGSPTGTIPVNGTLVVANLKPGTYTSTERDPAPEFDVTSVTCDDGESETPSSGDAGSRTAVFNLDPGEMVTCSFVNTRRGAAVVAVQTEPEGAEGSFLFTGVPSGTLSAGGTLVVADLTPGTYTTTEADPAPDFELTEVSCDDGESGLASSGDASTRTAIFNIDPGETVTCSFINEASTDTEPGEGGSGSGGSEGSGGDDADGGDAINPFDDPEEYLSDFPLPDELPSDAGSQVVPKAGPWIATNFAGQMNCGANSLGMPASPPEAGNMEVLDGGATVIGTGLQEDETVPITMTADPTVAGRYTGAVGGTEQGIPVTINYFWQVVNDEYIVGFLTSTFSAEGVTCSIYRPYELRYDG